MSVPRPTPIFRFIHVDNLQIYLERGGLHAPRHTPNDGRQYKTVHSESIQRERRITRIQCGPQGVIHDYVPFYLGPRSPMLYRLHTGWETDYDEGQEPLIYLVSTAQAIDKAGTGFVFSDGHGIAAFTQWFDGLDDLDNVDWDVVYAQWWKDDADDPDRQRRKQAEFLVHQFCDWSLIEKVAVVNRRMQTKVRKIMGRFPAELHRDVLIEPDWYY